MSLLLNHTSIKPKLAAIDLPLEVNIKLQEQKISATRLSKNIGRSEGYLNKQLQNPDPTVGLLSILSVHLMYNFFNPYLDILPYEIRPTKAEQALQQQITALQQELEAVKKERDIYKGIVMK